MGERKRSNPTLKAGNIHLPLLVTFICSLGGNIHLPLNRYSVTLLLCYSVTLLFRYSPVPFSFIFLYPPINPLSPPPFPVEELLLKLQDLQSAVNTGKDSL
jgi:hypothetical protein